MDLVGSLTEAFNENNLYFERFCIHQKQNPNETNMDQIEAT